MASVTGLAPIVLIPTPAQVAAGTRTVEAKPEQVPAGAVVLLRLCEAAGIEARPTYALAMLPPSGRRTEWVKLETVAVRMAGFGWAVWENGRFGMGQCGGATAGLREITRQVKERIS